MPASKRAFRGEDSITAERITRDSVAPFLAERGFEVLEDKRNVTGTATEQFVSARSHDGQFVKMRVRICWRREGRHANERKVAAAQLRARLRNDDWEATLRFIVERDRQHGNTHNLIIQRDGAAIVFAALIPRDALMPIWLRQRYVSSDLHRRGLMKGITKNHAMNGSSPTIWLQDDRTPDAQGAGHVVGLARGCRPCQAGHGGLRLTGRHVRRLPWNRLLNYWQRRRTAASSGSLRGQA